MKISVLMTVKAISAIIVGWILLIAPDLFLTLLGVPISQGAAMYGRLYGAACLGIFMLTWFARHAEESTARWAIILDLCVYDAIAFIVTMIVMLSSKINALGWLFAAFYLFFTLTFGYFLFPKKAKI